MLAASLVGLIAWKLVIRFSLIPAGHPLAAGIRSKDLTTHATVVVVCLALAGGVSALAYFAAGRSQRAASVGSAAVMLLAIGVFATQLVLYYTGYRGPSAAQNTAGANTSPSFAEEMEAQTRQVREQSEQHHRQMQQQANRAQEELERLARPIVPGGSSPSQRPALAAPTVGQTPTPPKTPPAPVVPTAEEPAVERTIKAALDPVREEIRVKTTEFLAAAQPAADALAKLPNARHSELDARIKSTGEMKQKAKELGAYLRAADERAAAALKSAGLDLGDQVRAKVTFSQSENLFSKANACGNYERLFDAGLEEAQALKETAGKWKIDGSGQATSTDTSVKHRLHHLREGVLMRMRGVRDAENTLKPTGAS